MKLITLLTDFTERDGYVGVMKGVIYRIAPDARVVDLSHEIPPQNVFQAALLLGRSTPYFPDDTVHVGVVDPGVGTPRRAIAARLESQYFVGPDNGLMTLLYASTRSKGLPAQIHCLENPRYQLPEVSRSFHGRDIFAPAAAHLVNGTALSEFGDPVKDPILIDIPIPQRTHNGWTGSILYTDAFGNLSSNICAEYLSAGDNPYVIIGSHVIKKILNTFSEGREGEIVAILDSFGYLSVCVVNGSAAKLLKIKAGETILVVYS